MVPVAPRCSLRGTVEYCRQMICQPPKSPNRTSDESKLDDIDGRLSWCHGHLRTEYNVHLHSDASGEHTSARRWSTLILHAERILANYIVTELVDL